MYFRKAEISDLSASFSIYKAAIKHMEELGIFQWDDYYPTIGDISGDIESGSHYLGFIGGEIASAFTLNTESDREYEEGSWRWPELPYTVIHRLCVAPEFQHRGVGFETMKYIEAYSKQCGFGAIRLDTFSQNPYSIRLYGKLGYVKVGEITFRKGVFYLFEKKL